MHRVGVDLFQAGGKHFVVLVDGYSGFPFVSQLRSLNTKAVIKALSTWFCDFGYPTIIRTDGGPQFRSEFKAFCHSIGAEKETSSPYYPQSNGLAEAAVKQTKRLLTKHGHNMQDFLDALLIWRNTPKANGFTPSDLMFGYTQNFGQGQTSNFAFIYRQKAAFKKSIIENQKTAHYNSKSRLLPALLPNSSVLVLNPKTHSWDSAATISAIRPDGHSYEIIDADLNMSIRNRRDLRPLLS